MLRVAVAVALATALLGASMPAVETARVDHAHARVDAEIDGLAATAELLLERNDPAPPGVPGARRTQTLHLPGPSWASAGLASLVIPGPSADTPPGTVSWRVVGGRETTRRLPAPLVGPEGSLRLTGGGTRRLVLEHARQDGEEVVVVRRPELKSDGGARAGHDVTGNGSRRPVRG
jgi:hypothetical protein